MALRFKGGRGWGSSDDKKKPPSIEISVSNTPVDADKTLRSVAVLYLTPQETEAVKSFAEQVKNRRGNVGEQSVTISWSDRKASSSFGGGTDTRMMFDGSSLANSPGWTSFYNQGARRFEYVDPDNKRYIQQIGTSDLVEVPATCNKGHDLPKGQSWCRICDGTYTGADGRQYVTGSNGMLLARPNNLQSGEVWMCSNNHVVEGEYATCPECEAEQLKRKIEPEKKLVDRFSGLEL